MLCHFYLLAYHSHSNKNNKAFNILITYTHTGEVHRVQ